MMDLDHFSCLPVEMKLQILRHLSHDDCLTFRLVNSFGKILISDLIREWPGCILSNDTFHIVANSDEIFRKVRISELTDVVKSAIPGIAKALSNARYLQLYDHKIEVSILQLIRSHFVNVFHLEFFNPTEPIVKAALDDGGKVLYPNVTLLALRFHCSVANRFSAWNWNNLDGVPLKLAKYANVALPQLQELIIDWTDPRAVGPNVHDIHLFCYRLYKVIASVADKLTSLEFLRDENTVELCRDEFHTPFARLPFGNLRNLKLQKLKISTSTGDDDIVGVLLQMERTLFQSAHLQELHVENIFARSDAEEEMVNFPTVASLLPARSVTTLQRLVIFFTYFEDAGPLSLAVFGACSQLKELTLVIYQYCHTLRHDHKYRLSDLNRLPKSLELLQLVPPHDDEQTRDFRKRFPSAKDSSIILSRAQLQWLVAGNLPNLKHLGCLLIVVNEVLRWAVEQNSDLPLFKELVAMKQLQRLEFNMFVASRNTKGRHRTLGLQSYLDFCQSQTDIRRMEVRKVIDKYAQISLIRRVTKVISKK